MESGLPTTTTATPMAAKPGGNVSADPFTSSPDSNTNTEKHEDSSFLSSDAGDSSMLRHPKGKRKRTAAKDKSILETAYLANPKPDKTARLEIVSQVSLNEKEVQIWFQNRRQNDRRKSRPLSPQEIAALRYGGLYPMSSDPSSFGHPTLSQHSSFASDGASSSPPHHPQFNSASMMPAMNSTSSPESGARAAEAQARRQSVDQERQPQPQQTPNHLVRTHEAASENGNLLSTPATSSFSSSMGSVGYLANRWNMHSSVSSSPSLGGGNCTPGTDSPCGDAARPEPFVRTASPHVLPPPTQQQQAPAPRPFRLHLSLEGKAEVMPSQSPSPPRRLPPPHSTISLDRRSSSGSSSEGPLSLASLPAIRRSGLNRSQSALASTCGLTLPPISSLTSSLASGAAPPPMPHSIVHPPRLLRGRSRDVHAWESVCDAETRVDDELSAHAENEASGSAIAAISLLRSASSCSASSLSAVLQPNGSRRNSLARPGAPRPGQKRSKLGRALSSVARMQNSNAPRESWLENGKDDGRVWVDDEKKKKLKLSTLLSGGGDSDKENWSPEDESRSSAHAARTAANAVAAAAGANVRRNLPPSRNGPQQRPALGEGKAVPNARPVSRASGKGPCAFDGHNIYEDANGGDSTTGSPTKRLQLSRAPAHHNNTMASDTLTKTPSHKSSASHATDIHHHNAAAAAADYGYPHGHVGFLSESETKAFADFKAYLAERKLYTPGDAATQTPPSHDDPTLLRFLRARRWIVEEAYAQFKDTEDWRHATSLNVLYDTIDLEAYEQSRRLYPQWTGRRDKRGIPLYLFVIRHLDSKTIATYEKTANNTYSKAKPAPGADKSSSRMLRLFALYENLTRFAQPLCTEMPDREHAATTPITLSTNIVDVSGVSLRQFWNLKSHMQAASTLATAHYPETLDRIFIIGAPMFFSTVWGWVKRWFDPVTVSKIFILPHAEVLPTLLSFIDIKNIPKQYGGELEFNWGDMPNLDPAIRSRVTWETSQQNFPGGPMYWRPLLGEDKYECIAVGSEKQVERHVRVCTIPKVYRGNEAASVPEEAAAAAATAAAASAAASSKSDEPLADKVQGLSISEKTDDAQPAATPVASPTSA